MAGLGRAAVRDRFEKRIDPAPHYHFAFDTEDGFFLLFKNADMTGTREQPFKPYGSCPAATSARSTPCAAGLRRGGASGRNGANSPSGSGTRPSLGTCIS